MPCLKPPMAQGLRRHRISSFPVVLLDAVWKISQKALTQGLIEDRGHWRGFMQPPSQPHHVQQPSVSAVLTPPPSPSDLPGPSAMLPFWRALCPGCPHLPLHSQSSVSKPCQRELLCLLSSWCLCWGLPSNPGPLGLSPQQKLFRLSLLLKQALCLPASAPSPGPNPHEPRVSHRWAFSFSKGEKCWVAPCYRCQGEMARMPVSWNQSCQWLLGGC